MLDLDAMEFILTPGSGTYTIEGYDHQGIRINGKLYQSPLFIMPDCLVNPWGPKDIQSLSSHDFEMMLSYKPQVVLLGTGPKLYFPAKKLYEPLIKNKIGIEIMDTPAACRTYAVLASEGRRVAAALFI